MPGQGIPRSTEELDIEGIRITTGEPHFILKVAREAYKKSGKTGEPDHKTLQEWCNSRDGYKAHLSKALNDAIEAGIRDGSRTVLSSEKKPNGGKVFRNEHGGELEETVVPGKGIRFNAKGNFTGQIQIPRVGKDNKHIPGAFDVVDFENGKVVSRVYAKAPNGQPIGKSQLDKAYLDEQMGIDTGTRVVAASTRSSAERAIVDTGIVVAAPPGSLVPSATPGGPAQTPGQGVGGGGGGRGGV